MTPKRAFTVRVALSICILLMLVCSAPIAAQEVTDEEEETPVADTEEARETPTKIKISTEEKEGEAVTEEEEKQEEEEDIPTSLQLTVYNQNLGLIKEIRSFDLESGENWIRFTDVASSIRPTSVHISSLTAPTQTMVLEQNYEYDLVDSQKLLQKYIDQEISVRTSQGDLYTGVLLSGSNDIILDTGEQLRVIRLGEIQEFNFPALPESLITRPSLVWLLETTEEGAQDLQVTYLTGGIDWRADYTALLDADDRSLSLAGWVTVDNRSGASYEEAKLKLVAGEVHRVEDAPMALEREAVMSKAMPTPQVEERSFFEYHIYQVQRLVTVKNNQTKQIEFVSAPKVAAERALVLNSSPRMFPGIGNVYEDPSYGAKGEYRARVELRFTNDEESGLGLPLPQGLVRVYKEDVDGSAEFVGEDSIDHTPKNEDLSLYLGEAFDVVGERTQLEFRQLEKRMIEETCEINVRNHKEEAIDIAVVENLFRAHDSEVIESSHEYDALDANTIQYMLSIPADSDETVTYTVVYRW